MNENIYQRSERLTIDKIVMNENPNIMSVEEQMMTKGGNIWDRFVEWMQGTFSIGPCADMRRVSVNGELAHRMLDMKEAGRLTFTGKKSNAYGTYFYGISPGPNFAGGGGYDDDDCDEDRCCNYDDCNCADNSCYPYPYP